MNKVYRIVSIGLVLFLLLSIDSIHSQQSHNCQYLELCYDPELTISPGDEFNWETNGIRIKNDYYDRAAGLFPIKIIKNVQLQILRSPNGEKASIIFYPPPEYFKFIINYEYEHNGTKIIEGIQSMSSFIFGVPFISPTMIYYEESDFQNQFKIMSSIYPERTQTHIETGENLDGLIEVKITITNRVENGIYEGTRQTTRVLQPNDSSLGSVLLSTENSVTRIDANTGILLEYNYKMSDANGNVVDSSSIRNFEWNQTDGVLDLGVFENSVLFLMIFVTIIAIITIYYKIRR